MENIIKLIKQNKSIKYGFPFIFLVIGGSFGLKEFAQLRYYIEISREIVKLGV